MSILTAPTGFDAWLDENPARHGPEVDFGTIWTSEFALGDHRVSFVEGTGELIVVDDRDTDVRVLGRYLHPVEAEDALGHWSTEVKQPGSLDRLLERFPDYHQVVTVHVDDRAVYAIVLDANGERERIHDPGAELPFENAVSDMFATPVDVEGRRLTLWSESYGLDRSVNPVATLLAATGHPVTGRAAIEDLERDPLPQAFIDSVDSPSRSVEREWMARDFNRRHGDIEYGSGWTSNSDLDETWHVRWNIGSGELYRVNSAGTSLQVLGVYPDRRAVDTTLEGWGSAARRPGGLDQLVGMPPIGEPRFVDRVDQLEQRLAMQEPFGLDIDPGNLDPSSTATVIPEPDFYDDGMDLP
jgi:hypothetical protein